MSPETKWAIAIAIVLIIAVIEPSVTDWWLRRRKRNNKK